MPPFVALVTQILSALTVLADIAIGLFVVAVLIGLVNTPFRQHARSFLAHIGRHGALYAFVITLGATLGSLYYSVIAQFEPCNLCWWQRIFMYPLPVLYAVHLARRDHTDKNIIYETFALGGIGAAIALFHYWGQMFQNSILPCPTVGLACASTPFLEYGYVTIPMMSLSIFVLAGICMAARLIYLKSRAPR